MFCSSLCCRHLRQHQLMLRTTIIERLRRAILEVSVIAVLLIFYLLNMCKITVICQCFNFQSNCYFTRCCMAPDMLWCLRNCRIIISIIIIITVLSFWSMCVDRNWLDIFAKMFAEMPCNTIKYITFVCIVHCTLCFIIAWCMCHPTFC